MDTKDHWERQYTTKNANEVSWFQAEPRLSMELIQWSCPERGRVVDVGGGASLLVDRLLDEDFSKIAVLDISPQALEEAKTRLGKKSERVQWIEADITAVATVGEFDVWHDRAVFHFLTSPDDRRKYVDLATRTVLAGGHLVVGTFAQDGPTRCSGLDVCRYDPESLAAEFGSAFRMVRHEREIHSTPSGKSQPFTFVVLGR